MSLLRVEEQVQPKVNILELETYQETFGPNSRRKKVKLNYENLEEMQNAIEMKDGVYEVVKDKNLNKQDVQQ